VAIFEIDYMGDTYVYDGERMSLPEARFAKAQTGHSGLSFFQAAADLDPDALTTLLVMAMKRRGIKATVQDIYRDDENGYFKLISSMRLRSGDESAEQSEPPSVETVELPAESE
jgi:hypothetical protein